MSLAFYTLGAFVAALLLVPMCRAAAIRLGYVASPKADRWHRRKTALMGGVAIATVVLVGSVTLRPFSDIAVFVMTGAAIAAFGLADDVLVLKPATKLVVQITLASVCVFFGARLHWVESLTLQIMLTLIWIVGVTNAFNLLDNMDGLSSGVGLIVSVTLLTGFIYDGHSGPHAKYLALLIGALAGFLVYNFNPASVFMGDSGSLFIGMTLATMALEPTAGGRSGQGLLAVIAAPLMVLLIPIFDTSFVTVSRLLSGRSPAQGGRDHSSHRLVAIGLSERAAVGVLWTLAGLGGLIAIALRTAPDVVAPLAVTFVLSLVIFAVYLSRVRVYGEIDTSQVTAGRVTLLVADIMHKRRAAEVLLDFWLIALSYYAAYRLRFEGPDFVTYFPQFLSSLPIVVALQISALFLVGGYRGVWRYFGLMDGVTFGKGVAIGTGAIVVTVLYLFRFENYSRGVFVIYAALVMLALTCSRASFRLISEFVSRRRAGRRLVIYGAGDGGALVVRELLASTSSRYSMVGFVDDDPAKHKARVHGFPVLGGLESVIPFLESGGVDEIVVSIRDLDPSKVHHLEDICEQYGIALRRVRFSFEQLVAS